MNLSYQEKSNWGSLIVISLTFGYYFYSTRDLLLTGKTEPGAIVGTFIAVILVIILVEVAYEVLIVIAGSSRTDERDRFIVRRGTLAAYYLLTGGVFVSIGYLCWGLLAYPEKMSVLLAVHLMLLCVVVAEIGRFSTQIWLYRREG